jgi:hypothetical protein
MALLLIEGFDTYNYATDAYLASSIGDFPIERTITNSGQGSLNLSGSSTLKIVIPFGGTSNEVYIGFAFYQTARATSDNAIFEFLGGGGGDLYLTQETTGVLKFELSAANKTPTSGANVLQVNTWHYIEVKIVKKNSIDAGDVSLRVDGAEWIELDAATDTLYSVNPAYTDTIEFRCLTGAERYIDDLYVCDETGPINNTFLGPVKVETLYPDGEGDVNDFTGSDADSTDNHLHVDEVTGQDDDTSYVESDTADHIDLYTLDDMAATIDIIHGIDAVSVVKNDVMGGGSVRQGASIVRIGGSNYQGDTFNIGSPYTHRHNILEENPDDAAAWEEADINALEAGIKVVA